MKITKYMLAGLLLLGLASASTEAQASIYNPDQRKELLNQNKGGHQIIGDLGGVFSGSLNQTQEIYYVYDWEMNFSDTGENSGQSNTDEFLASNHAYDYYRDTRTGEIYRTSEGYRVAADEEEIDWLVVTGKLPKAQRPGTGQTGDQSGTEPKAQQATAENNYTAIINDPSPVVTIGVITEKPADPSLVAGGKALAGALESSELQRLTAILKNTLSEADVKNLGTVLGKLSPEQIGNLLSMLQSGQKLDAQALLKMAGSAGVTLAEAANLNNIIGKLKNAGSDKELAGLLQAIGERFKGLDLPADLKAQVEGADYQAALQLVLSLRNASNQEIASLVNSLKGMSDNDRARLLLALGKADASQLALLLNMLKKGDIPGLMVQVDKLAPAETESTLKYAVYDPNTKTTKYYSSEEEAERMAGIFQQQYASSGQPDTLYAVIHGQVFAGDPNKKDMASYGFVNYETIDGRTRDMASPGSQMARVSGGLTDSLDSAGSGSFSFDVNIGSGQISNAGMNYSTTSSASNHFNLSGGGGSANGSGFTITGMTGTVSTGASGTGTGSMTGTTPDSFNTVSGTYNVEDQYNTSAFDGTFSGAKQ